MQNFVWGCFENTGSIDAYLLYKSVSEHNMNLEVGEEISNIEDVTTEQNLNTE